MVKICANITAVIVDLAFAKGPHIVNATLSLPDHRTVVHLKKKACKCLGPGGVSGKGWVVIFKSCNTSMTNMSI